MSSDLTAGVSHADLANAIRALSMDAVEAAKSGHPGMPMGMADVATVLFTQFLKFDPKRPDWADRDRFILSAGHGSMLQYSLMYLTGYEDITLDEIKRFRQMGAKTAGHPEYGMARGIEMTTGPLGQGISTAVGFAMAERILNARFGDDLVDHTTYVIAGDGDLQEGISHEASSLAGHLGLSKLIVLWDDNRISIDGSTDLSFTEDVKARYAAYNWDVSAVDGHDPVAVAKAIAAAKLTDKPSLIACRTTIGYGAPTKANTAGSHGSPLGAAEIEGARKALNWPHAPFEIPESILHAWRHFGDRGHKDVDAWVKRLARSPNRLAFKAAIAGDLSAEARAALHAHKKAVSESKPKIATRQSSGNTLDVIVPLMPEMMGGSADLTGSNNTRVKALSKAVQKDSWDGRYVHYGVREHGMAAIMNGMALHGGIIPYSGTFLAFSDYSRPAIRLGALMKQRVIHVMTHDSIGLGEDGPTHQPVEHIPALRCIPNLLVLRPADAVEAAEAWEIALDAKTRPSVLALTRQNLATMRVEHTDENLSAKGAYVLREASGPRKVTLLATGSEVEIAFNAREKLEAEGIPTALVSMPSWELFAEQPEAYQKAVLGDGLRIGVEAMVRFGWDRWIGEKGVFIGMPGFGESAPYQELYAHFGITAEAIVKAAKERL
ncbi:transketolase [Niveispirillum cyanobacteriorum]|uniref:Transketolase n=1 Tax=Niveispirillum cyanobacteriorum TaxID=1612173 RepID=A0A2K9N8D8_9PROT|nr:transketolase [Niveispirillum cyanobacteriorum]AUN29252.1 transketolase [Niveispirillum cyanobacteriorum]GGE66042.1 transketolase [Niveispirillum cyanobacteriorum]